MSQMTIRVPEELVERVRHAAEDAGQSMNEYVTQTLDIRTNPELANTETERVRERFARAGMLADVGKPVARPDPASVARARANAARGTSGSDLVSESRG